MRRVSVVGNSGSGKSTVARAIAQALDAPHMELDAFFHQPNWQPLERELFRAEVTEFVAGHSWVVDGNYDSVRDLVWQRADTVVWLDLPRGRIMRQLAARTLRRMLTRTELWNGNTEQLRFLLNPKYSILWWAWVQHGKYVKRYGDAERDPAYRHLTFVRLRSRAETAQFVAACRTPHAAGESSGSVTDGGAAGE